MRGGYAAGYCGADIVLGGEDDWDAGVRET